MDKRTGKRPNWEATVVSTQEMILAQTGVLAIEKERNRKMYFESFIKRVRISILWM